MRISTKIGFIFILVLVDFDFNRRTFFFLLSVSLLVRVVDALTELQFCNKIEKETAGDGEREGAGVE